jgi:hypothetical protein
MFRKFLSLSAGVLALLCVTGIPGQLYAQGTRSSFRAGGLPQTPRVTPSMNRQFTDPRFGRFSPGFDRRFMDPRFGRFNPGFGRFSPGFGRLNSIPVPVPVPVPVPTVP